MPLPQNAIGIFRNQFLRFGYNSTEMIQVCSELRVWTKRPMLIAA